MAAAIARSARCAPAGFVWLYPTVGELSKARGGADWLPERSEIVSGAQANGLHVIDIAQEPMWNASLYRSDGVHPTVQGTAVLGAILARVIAADAVLRQDCGRARAS
jgi:lysophospholipase L1-like esterase